MLWTYGFCGWIKWIATLPSTEPRANPTGWLLFLGSRKILIQRFWKKKTIKVNIWNQVTIAKKLQTNKNDHFLFLPHIFQRRQEKERSCQLQPLGLVLRLTKKEPVNTSMYAFTLFHMADKDQKVSAHCTLTRIIMWKV